MFSLFISFIACSEYNFHSPTKINQRPNDEIDGFTDGLIEDVTTGTETPVSYTVEFAELYDASIELEVSSGNFANSMDQMNLKSDVGVHRVRQFLKCLDFVTEADRVASAPCKV